MAKVKHKVASETVGEEVDSVEWADEDIHELTEEGEVIVSAPPTGYYKVYGICMKKIGSKFHPVFIHDDMPEP